MYSAVSLLASRNCEVDVSRNAFGKVLRQPHFGPPAARPLWALCEALVEGGQRKIQKHDESTLVHEKVVEHMRRRIVGREDAVEREYGAKVQIGLLTKFPVNLMHMA